MTLLQSLLDSCYGQECKQMARPYGSASSTYRVLWNLTLQKNNSFETKKKHVDVSIFETIQAGACWPSVRCNGIPQADEVCPLCLEPNPDKGHCFWTCPSSNDADEEVSIDTQKVIVNLKNSPEYSSQLTQFSSVQHLNLFRSLFFSHYFRIRTCT